MVIRLDENYNAMTSTALLGYVGETNARPVSVEGLTVDGADRYVLTIDYGDGTVYDVDISDGTWTPTADILRSAQTVSCQIAAKKLAGDEYVLVKKSRIFRLRIGAAIGDTAVPSPDVAMDALDRIGAIGRQAHADMQTAVTAAETATTATENAEKSATTAGVSADTAEQAASRAETAQASAETSATQAETAMQGAENARQQAVTAQNAAKISADQASVSAQQTTADKTATAGYAQTAKTNADSTTADRQAVQDMAAQVTADKAIVADHAAKVAEDRTAAETAAQTAQAVADSLPEDYVTAVGKIAENTAEINNTNTEVSELKEDLGKLENGGITPPMINKKKEYASEATLEPIEVFQDKYIGAYSTTDLSPLLMDGGKYTIKEVDVETANKLVFPVGTTAGYSYNNAITFSGFYSDRRPNLYLNGYTLDNLKAKGWALVTEETITIDLALMKETEGFKLASMNPTWDMLRYAYVSVPNASDKVIAEVITVYNETLDNFKWLDIADDTEIVVPSKWVTCTGLEYNFYKDNCLLGRRIDDVHLLNFAVTDGLRNTNWYQDKYRSIWIPRSNMVTDRVISLYKNNHKTLTQSKNISCVSVSPTSGSGKTRSAIIIGDSKIAGGRVVERVYKKCNENGMNFTLKGTIQAWGMSQYNHEGRSGWSAYNYTHDESYRDVVNPFWYNSEFNFSHYMTSNGYTDVDYVFINLGTNDVSMGYGDEFIENVDAMITSIHSFNPNIHIIIGLNEGMCTREYNSNILDYNEKVQELHKKEIARWDNRENEKIYVCPIYISMDYYNDYDMTEVPLSAVDTECETSKTRISVDDTTHQSKVGYYKNGDYMFAMIQYIESLT